MFDKAPGGRSLLNRGCRLYQEIARIAEIVRQREPLRFGRMYYRQIADESLSFGLPFGSTYTLAFSRLLYGQEILIAYNVSGAVRHDRVVVDATLHPDPSQMAYLYGKLGAVPVQTAPSGARFVQLDLDAHQFVILA